MSTERDGRRRFLSKFHKGRNRLIGRVSRDSVGDVSVVAPRRNFGMDLSRRESCLHPFNRIKAYVWPMVLAGLVVGCAARREEASFERSEGAGRMELGQAKIQGDLVQLAEIRSDAVGSSPVPGRDRTATTTPSESKIAASRLMIRTGSVRLATPEIDSVLDKAERLAAGLGGYTDRRDPRWVVLRVPVAKFDEAFKKVQLLGRVLDQWSKAQDVTDEFTDVGLQIVIKKRYLAKLQQILAKETDLERRKALIQEIQAGTEFVEQLERRQAALKRDAAMSTLTVYCEEPRRRSLGAGREQDLEVFRWIHGLQGRADDDRSERGRRLRLAVPSGMVELPRKHSGREWMAASPEGCEFRARRIPNQPAGDAGFWQEALRLRLAGGFGVSDTATVGGWKTLRLVSAEPRAWTWLLAVRIEGKRIHLAQSFCPDSGLDRRMRPAVERALREEAP